MNHFIAILYFATFLVLFRGVTGLFILLYVLDWCARHKRKYADKKVDSVPLLVVLPLLREQVVFKKMMEYFLRLAQDHGNMSLIVVTTSRENKEREVALLRSADLASDLVNNLPVLHLQYKYRGVLPRSVLAYLSLTAKDHSLKEASNLITEAFEAWPTTDELVINYLHQCTDEARSLVNHVHYPKEEGTMADQVNYAVVLVLGQLKLSEEAEQSTYIALYNADSQPAIGTFNAISNVVHDQSSRRKSRPEIIQQSALFLGNFDQFDNSIGGYTLKALGLLQTRWTLCREVPRLIVQSKIFTRFPNQPTSWISKVLLSPLGHCVGHGLFMRADVFNQLGGLPTSTMNEDLSLGYCISAARMPIFPMHLFELADSPESLTEAVMQKKQWFWSYLQYPQCSRIAKSFGFGDAVSRGSLVAQGCFVGLAWLTVTPFILMTILLPFVEHTGSALLFTLTALCSYYIAPFIIILKSKIVSFHVDGATIFGCTTFGLIAYISHSMGPLLCCVDAVRAKIVGRMPQHGKTER